MKRLLLIPFFMFFMGCERTDMHVSNEPVSHEELQDRFVCSSSTELAIVTCRREVFDRFVNGQMKCTWSCYKPTPPSHGR